LNTKDELDLDEKIKSEELENLGYLSKFLNNPTLVIDAKQNDSGKEKDKNNSNSSITFIAELNGIDDKVKAECAKIYVGDYAKLINNPDKIPTSLNNFLINLKSEMQGFRLKCVRDLRTYVNNKINFYILIFFFFFLLLIKFLIKIYRAKKF
jgi:hypothetical protein